MIDKTNYEEILKTVHHNFPYKVCSHICIVAGKHYTSEQLRESLELSKWLNDKIGKIGEDWFFYRNSKHLLMPEYEKYANEYFFKTTSDATLFRLRWS